MIHGNNLHTTILHKEVPAYPQPYHLYAPGWTFNPDRPEGCMAYCLGVCSVDKECPFLGCAVDASGFNPGAEDDGDSTPTLH